MVVNGTYIKGCAFRFAWYPPIVLSPVFANCVISLTLDQFIHNICYRLHSHFQMVINGTYIKGHAFGFAWYPVVQSALFANCFTSLTRNNIDIRMMLTVVCSCNGTGWSLGCSFTTARATPASGIPEELNIDVSVKQFPLLINCPQSSLRFATVR